MLFCTKQTCIDTNFHFVTFTNDIWMVLVYFNLFFFYELQNKQTTVSKHVSIYSYILTNR